MNTNSIGIAVLAALAALGLAAAASAEHHESAAAAEPVGEAVSEADPVSEATSGWVERAALTTAVVEREPQDEVAALTTDHDQVYYFTELRGFEGRTLTHRWEHGGAVVAEVPMSIGGPRWRTYSSKQLLPEQLGVWTVSVVDESGNVIDSRSFTYAAAQEASAPPAAPAPAEAEEAPAP